MQLQCFREMAAVVACVAAAAAATVAEPARFASGFCNDSSSLSLSSNRWPLARFSVRSLARSFAHLLVDLFVCLVGPVAKKRIAAAAIEKKHKTNAFFSLSSQMNVCCGGRCYCKKNTKTHTQTHKQRL